MSPNWDEFSFEEELQARKVKSKMLIVEFKKIGKINKNESNKGFILGFFSNS